jgi:hypothetical protein
MVKRSLVIPPYAPITTLGVGKDGKHVINNNPLRIEDKLYRLSEKGDEYVYSGTVCAVSSSAPRHFNHIPSLGLIIPHNSSPVNPHLKVDMAFDDAVAVTVEFEDPQEQVICICGVNVRLSKAMDA